jgi:hypothetical protein
LQEHSEPKHTLRPDLLQNLERGQLILSGLPHRHGPVLLQVPAEPPGLSQACSGTPQELIALSKQTYVMTCQRPPSQTPEEPSEEDNWPAPLPAFGPRSVAQGARGRGEGYENS